MSPRAWFWSVTLCVAFDAVLLGGIAWLVFR